MIDEDKLISQVYLEEKRIDRGVWRCRIARSKDADVIVAADAPSEAAWRITDEGEETIRLEDGGAREHHGFMVVGIVYHVAPTELHVVIHVRETPRVADIAGQHLVDNNRVAAFVGHAQSRSSHWVDPVVTAIWTSPTRELVTPHAVRRVVEEIDERVLHRIGRGTNGSQLEQPQVLCTADTPREVGLVLKHQKAPRRNGCPIR
eukprot:2037324-Rhodomonas_salina.2